MTAKEALNKINAAILLAVVCCVIFSGCGKTKKAETSEVDERFLILNDTNNGMNGYRQIIVDRETGVMYLFVGKGSKGGLAVMVDAEGNPLIYNGEYGE